MQLENIKELLIDLRTVKRKLQRAIQKSEIRKSTWEKWRCHCNFFRRKKKEKKDRKWQPAAGCAVGVLFLLGILIFRYLGYFPEIPIEVVLGAAILLMGVGAGWTWMEEKKEEKTGTVCRMEK